MVVTIILIIATMLLSAFFSGMEIAFLSSNKLKLEIEKKQSGAFSYVANLFTRNPGQYITTILIGNNISLVVYSLQMSLLIQAIMSSFNAPFSDYILLETVVSTIIIIFFAEFIPKTVVRTNPNFYFRTFAFPVYLFYLIFYPISMFSTFFSKMVLRLVGVRSGGRRAIATFDKVDLAHLLEEASSSDADAAGGNNDSDIKLFQNALEFPDLKARDCMTPRVDIYAVDIDDSMERLRNEFVSSSFSRIPVYEGSVDNIVGYVNSKSMFRNPSSIREVVRKLIFVPESMEIQRLLSNFIKHHSSIAVVIDEFGGTAGLITIEDILEEIFGEIEDEHDSPDMVEKVVNDSEFVFSGRLEVELLNERYKLEIPESDDYDTLAGFIIHNHNNLPKQGETLEIGSYTIKVLRMDGSRIDLVRLTVK